MKLRNILPVAFVTPAILLLMASCSDGQASHKAEQTANTAISGDGAVLADAGSASQGNTAGTDGADDRPRREFTESDRLSIEMAENDCKFNEFAGFFRAFSRSWAVRERYTAVNVQFGSAGASRRMPMRQYLDQNNFPIAPMDNGYVTAESAMKFDLDGDNADWRSLVFVELSFETASDNRQRVDWVAGTFERNLDPPPAYLEEGLGKLLKAKSRGYLLFEPTDKCWELTQDVVTMPWAD
jgi:hypothetical protein